MDQVQVVRHQVLVEGRTQRANARGDAAGALDAHTPGALRADLCAQARITQLSLVEFRRDADHPGLVSVSGDGHHLSMALTFVPDAILGPWLLGQREHGDIWSAVHRPRRDGAL